MMTNYRRAVAGAVFLMASAVSAQADNGADRASTTFKISGFVPVFCRVQLSANVTTPGADGVAQLGIANEFCNAPQGYRVIVRHPVDLEGAALIVHGVRIPLSADGETILTDSQRPDIRKLPLSIDLGTAPERFTSVGMRIEAKG